MRAFYNAEERRQRRWKADVIEVVAIGYSGCKTDEGIRAKQQMIELLRRD